MAERVRKVPRHRVFVGILGLILAGGCATTDGVLSGQKISQGEKAVNDAKASNAALDAPVELTAAEQKLGQAKEAHQKEEFERASRLAEEAAVEAEYARVKATTEKNRKTAEEMKKNIDTLRQEIEGKAR